VIAIDRTGLESASIKEIELTGKKSIVNASILNFGIDSNRVVLNWKSSNEEYAEMRVFKLNSSNNYIKIATIKKGNFTYVDQNLAKGNTYKYRIQSIKNNGQLSAFSNEVVVNY
jgi:fibronectin type 3 domain-containing protein